MNKLLEGKLNFNQSLFIEFPVLITLLIHIILIKLPFFFINIHIFVLSNQYSTGLLVSYITHGKTQLYETLNKPLEGKSKQKQWAALKRKPSEMTDAPQRRPATVLTSEL